MEIQELTSAWLDHAALSRAPKTMECYRAVCARINAIIGHTAVDTLTPAAVTRMLAGIMAHPRTAELAYIVLRLILRDHGIEGIMATVPRPRRIPQPASWWTEAEARAYLAASPTVGPWRLCWLLALCLGLRRGELAGLRWADVDLSAGLIRVRNQRQYVSGLGIIDGPPKSQAGLRDIPLPDDLAAILSDAQLMANADAALIGRKASRYVLAVDGHPLSPWVIDAAHRRQLAASGIRPITVHGLRHTMATMAISQGVDIRVLQTILGHASVTTTARVYAHVVTSAQRSAIASITRRVVQYA